MSENKNKSSIGAIVVEFLRKLGARIKESFRKFLVSLKRNPQNIPLVMLLVTFLYYSLNLTDMSDTTAKIQGTGMGLAQFCIILFSLLSLVCLLNAFPRRKKPNIPMMSCSPSSFSATSTTPTPSTRR